MDSFAKTLEPLFKEGRYEEALRLTSETVAASPNHRPLLQTLFDIAMKHGQGVRVEPLVRSMIEKDPGNASSHNTLGLLLYSQNRLEEAAHAFTTAIRLNPEFPDPIANLALIHLTLWNVKHAALGLERALALNPRQYFWLSKLGSVYRDLGRDVEALACFDRILSQNPENLNVRIRRAVSAIPVLFDQTEDIDNSREEYAASLEELTRRVASSKISHVSLDMVPFHLAYQCRNDVELQRRFGSILVALAKQIAPELAQPPSMPPVGAKQRIRVGILSAWMFPFHSNWKMPIEGWVRNLDRSKFELFGYYVGAKSEASLETVKQAFDGNLRIFRSMEDAIEIGRAVRKDQLHVLIHPEIGMSPLTTLLAALRLAPIQCSSWGHPLTSGLSTVDYFLSSDLMEPPGADAHYSETLVRLPNLSVHLTPLKLPETHRQRADFGIKADAVAYFCAQSLFKYLPQHDDIFADIARQVPEAQFVFIGHQLSEALTRRFIRRIEIKLERAGIAPRGRIVVVGHMPTQDFHALARCCDIFLDSIDWSGCNSALEAMQNGLPLATLPGEFMRGRHTFAFLRMMGVNELIAASRDTYVETVVRLGRDKRFRNAMRKKIAQRLPLLYGDRKCVEGLENFLRDAIVHHHEQDSRVDILSRDGVNPHISQPMPPRTNLLRDKIQASLKELIPTDRPIALIDFPDSLNCGDLAIWRGEKLFLASLGVTPAYECSMQSYNPVALKSALGTDGILLLHGGGNFGDRYVYHQFRNRVLSEFPNHDALIFPQTVNFVDKANLLATAALYKRRGRLTLCARDERSAELLREHFQGCRILTVPDMAMFIDPMPRNAPLGDILWLARTDDESRFSKGANLLNGAPFSKQIVRMQVAPIPDAALLTTYVADDVRLTDWYNLQLSSPAALNSYAALPFDQKALVQIEWARLILSLGKVVVTDRLHGHILCTLFGIPHVILDNNYGKLKSYVDTWSTNSNAATFSATPEDALFLARSMVKKMPAQFTDIRQVISAVRSKRLTYLTEARLLAIASICSEIERLSVSGIFLEAGTALGGSAVVIAKTKAVNRRLYLYDVFDTIPPPGTNDGEDAHARYREIAAGRSSGIQGDKYYGYQDGLQDKVRDNLARFDVIAAVDGVQLIPGLFQDTLQISEPVAFAHVDGDWYDSVTTCLERIAPKLAPGGTIVVDDYSDWSGCRRAVDDFLRANQGSFAFKVDKAGPAWISKPIAGSTVNRIWSDPASLAPHWSHRAVEVARYISPGDHVLDLGCGAMDLERYLPRGCHYTPCDLVARDARTIVCDLRRDELPVVSGVSIVTILGVCEYLLDLPGFFAKLRKLGVPAIVSYIPYDERTIPLVKRQELGWVSHLTLSEWIDCAANAGYKIDHLKTLSLDSTQSLFRLTVSQPNLR